MKTLLLDIETAPNTAYVWGLWDQNISHEHLLETSYILCWSAKWLGEKGTQFQSMEHTTPKKMLTSIHKLLDEAEVVVHFNGAKFDIPVLNKEFIKADLPPASPYKQVDLYRVVRKVFRFESNKLDAVCQTLGLGKKTKHQGFSLWIGCMKGDHKCWKEMEGYNRNDVVILEKLYHRLLPWIPSLPHTGVIEGKAEACPACGVVGQLQSRGVSTTKIAVYQRFCCQACGAWCRARTSEKGKAPKYV